MVINRKGDGNLLFDAIPITSDVRSVSSSPLKCACLPKREGLGKNLIAHYRKTIPLLFEEGEKKKENKMSASRMLEELYDLPFVIHIISFVSGLVGLHNQQEHRNNAS